MIYAINKRTKEHRVAPSFEVFPNPGWRYVKADAYGWIKWDRKGAPLPPGCPHEVKTEDGYVFHRTATEATKWRLHSNVDFYRPILDTKPEVPVWGGEGLPPVGCECDCYHTGTHQGVVTVRYMGSEMCVLLNHDHGEEQCGPIDAYSFRPIRSAEDTVVEAIARILADEFDATSEDYIDAARALYHAGYRKLEK